MARPKNSKNKPKVIPIKLSRLTEVFTPDTEILVDIRYAPLLAVEEVDLSEFASLFPIKQQEDKENKKPIAIQKIEFNK